MQYTAALSLDTPIIVLGAQARSAAAVLVDEPNAGEYGFRAIRCLREQSRGIDDLERGLVEPGSPFADDPDFLEELEDLDCGLADDDSTTAMRLQPLLEARLILPQPLSDEQQFPQERRSVASVRPDHPGGCTNAWMVSLILILLMLLGEAGAVLVFHDRVSNIAFQLETRLK